MGGSLKLRQPEPVRTLLKTTVMEMWAQPGPHNVATSLIDMTSIVPTLEHHLCKIQNPRKKGESDAPHVGLMPAPGEWSGPSI